MKFVSTRNKTLEKSFSEALLQGLCPEGGLFVPKTFPVLSDADMNMLCEQDYIGRAETILSKFCDLDVKEIVEKGYRGMFTEDEPAPLLKLDEGLFVLELFHGPTLAFKDIALRLLPRFFAEAKKIEGKSRTLILTATSGDTGKAAMDAFANVEDISVLVFYPSDGVSKMQQLQMLSQEGDNVKAVPVEGNFDHCQRAVKEMMGDSMFCEQAKKQGFSLGSANSVNIGRLLPQIVYYFSAYADLVNAGEIDCGDKINFSVPTGNFGNILAGFYAYKMGLPVGRLICASNQNNVLTDFFTTGTYDANLTLSKKFSPSMDILVSSNLERLLFELCCRDDQKVKKLMDRLKTSGRYEIDSECKKQTDQLFFAWYADEDDTKKTIVDFFEEYDYLLDPHTAIAMGARKKYIGKTLDETPIVVLATAHPYKFAPSVYEAVMDVEEEDDFCAAEELNDISALEIPESIAKLKKRKITPPSAADRQSLKDLVIKFLEEQRRQK